MTDSIEIRKIGIRFETPALVLFYANKGKLRKRLMPIRNFKNCTDSLMAVTTLKERHPRYLNSISNIQLQKLLNIIIGHQNGATVAETLAKLNDTYTVDPNEDLNKVEPDVLSQKKGIMNKTFEANRIKPGDKNYEYDIEVDFENDNDMVIESGWDSDKDFEF